MCLILFAYKSHPEYPLILAANRDEFLQRPTLPAHWWPEHPQLLAGKDLLAGGTWLGITPSARIAAITNVREPHKITGTEKSRGLIPLDYLLGQYSPEQYAAILQETTADYNGYNLLFGNYDNLYYYSNRIEPPQQLAPGVYGLSNAQLNTPWPKVINGTEGLQQLLQQPQLTPQQLLKVLAPTELAADADLPATGVSLTWERQLSAIRITGTEYATRTSTLLLIDRQRQVFFLEQQIAPHDYKPTEISFKLAN